MVGRSGGTLGGRERIVIVDELLATRLKRAARRHVLRRRQAWRTALPTSALLMLAVALPGLVAPERRLPSLALLGLPAVVLGVTALMLWLTVLGVHRHYDRELVPGRLVGLTVGTETLRYRDHDSSTEYAYSCIEEVVVLGDVIVVDFGRDFWSLPVELFDGMSLEVLRARAGRAALGTALWPELQADPPVEVAS